MKKPAVEDQVPTGPERLRQCSTAGQPIERLGGTTRPRARTLFPAGSATGTPFSRDVGESTSRVKVPWPSQPICSYTVESTLLKCRNACVYPVASPGKAQSCPSAELPDLHWISRTFLFVICRYASQGACRDKPSTVAESRRFSGKVGHRAKHRVEIYTTVFQDIVTVPVPADICIAFLVRLVQKRMRSPALKSWFLDKSPSIESTTRPRPKQQDLDNDDEGWPTSGHVRAMRT